MKTVYTARISYCLSDVCSSVLVSLKLLPALFRDRRFYHLLELGLRHVLSCCVDKCANDHMFAIRGEVKCQRLSASFCGECSQTAWHLHLSKDCQSLLLDRLQDPGILLGLRDILDRKSVV